MPKVPDKTSPDEIPSVDILAAAAREDVKEAHHLLAAFDKPGRGPKRPQGADFVSYYANKPMQPLEPSAAREQEKAERAAKTEVHHIPPHLVGRGMSKSTAWVFAGGAMLAIGGGVMWLALYVLPAPAPVILAPTAASAPPPPATVVATATANVTATTVTTTTAPVKATTTAETAPPATQRHAAPAVPATARPHKATPATSARSDTAATL